MPGRVRPSVTRSMREPNVGSANWKPAAPSDGSAGFAYGLRSVTALYDTGFRGPIGGAGAAPVVLKDQIGPAVAPTAFRAITCQ